METPKFTFNHIPDENVWRCEHDGLTTKAPTSVEALGLWMFVHGQSRKLCEVREGAVISDEDQHLMFDDHGSLQCVACGSENSFNLVSKRGRGFCAACAQCGFEGPVIYGVGDEVTAEIIGRAICAYKEQAELPKCPNCQGVKLLVEGTEQTAFLQCTCGFTGPCVPVEPQATVKVRAWAKFVKQHKGK